MSMRSPAPAEPKHCERCGEPAGLAVRLLETDMSTIDHALCGHCWSLLARGVTSRQPWVREPDPQSLYVSVAHAWSWMDEADAREP